MTVHALLSLLTVDLVVKITMAACFLTGIILLSYRDCLGLLEYRRAKNRKARAKTESAFDRNLRMLLAAAAGGKVSVKGFKTLSAGVFILFFALCAPALSVMVSFLLAAAMACLPYIALRFRLLRKRAKIGDEAETLVQNLMIEYRVSNYNIVEAIEAAVSRKELKEADKVLFSLLLRLRNTKSGAKIKEAADLFAFAIGTNWARMLAGNIYRAALDGGNVTEALEDILRNLKMGRREAEERKRLNAESERMLFLIPLSYLGTLLATRSFVGAPAKTFLANQFLTKEGVIFFVLIVLMTAVSCMLTYAARSKKFDF